MKLPHPSTLKNPYYHFNFATMTPDQIRKYIAEGVKMGRLNYADAYEAALPFLGEDSPEAKEHAERMLAPQVVGTEEDGRVRVKYTNPDGTVKGYAISPPRP